MDLYICLIIYLIIVVVITFILCKFLLPALYSITISLIIGQLLLLILYPPQNLNDNYGSSYALYLLIQFGTLIYMYIFVVISIVQYTKIKQTVIHVSSPMKKIKINVDQSY